MSPLSPRVVDSTQDLSAFRNTGSGDAGGLEEDGVVDDLRERVADVLGERVVDVLGEGVADVLGERVVDDLGVEGCDDELGVEGCVGELREVAVNEPGEEGYADEPG